MHKRLKWNAIGLESRTRMLLDAMKAEASGIDPAHTTKLGKLKGYMDELNYLLGTIERIQATLIPALEKKFRLTFKTPELIMIALSRPSIRNIFDDLKKHLEGNPDNSLSWSTSFKVMVRCFLVAGIKENGNGRFNYENECNQI